MTNPNEMQPPQYQVPAGAAPKKKSVWKWVVGILAALALLCGGGFVACTTLVGKGINDAVKESDAQDKARAAENAASCKGKPSYPDQQAGNDRCADASDAVTLDDVKVTATPLKRTGNSLCTSVKYNNNSSKTVSFNVFDWKLQLPTGEVKDAFDSTISSNELGSGDLVAGGTKTGTVCYEVAASGQFILIYKPSFWSDSRGIWINKL